MGTVFQKNAAYLELSGLSYKRPLRSWCGIVLYLPEMIRNMQVARHKKFAEPIRKTLIQGVSQSSRFHQFHWWLKGLGSIDGAVDYLAEGLMSTEPPSACIACRGRTLVSWIGNFVNWWKIWTKINSCNWPPVIRVLSNHSCVRLTWDLTRPGGWDYIRILRRQIGFAVCWQGSLKWCLLRLRRLAHVLRPMSWWPVYNAIDECTKIS